MNNIADDIFHRYLSIYHLEKFCKDDSCKAFLKSRKWIGEIPCVKCGCVNFRKGSSVYHRRCKNCGYEEAVTKNTLFEGTKFSLTKAFYVTYRYRSKSGKISAYKLHKETGLSIRTILKFKKNLFSKLNGHSQSLTDGKISPDNFLNDLV